MEDKWKRGMKGLSLYEIPGVKKLINESRCTEVVNLLKMNGFSHLKVLARGKHVVIYSEDDGEKINRVRFSHLENEFFSLGVANHRGRWEVTPFEGTLPELVEILTEQFSFLLIDF